MNFYVDDKDGHDDFVVSLALCVAAALVVSPAPAGAIIEPAPMYAGEGRFWGREEHCPAASPTYV